MTAAHDHHHRQQHQSKCAKCCYYCRIITTFIFSHVGLCALVFAYSFLGAFTFEWLEAHNELRKRKEMYAVRLKVIERLWQMTENSSVLMQNDWSLKAREELFSFEEKLIWAVRKEGYDGTLPPLPSLPPLSPLSPISPPSSLELKHLALIMQGIIEMRKNMHLSICCSCCRKR